jgi:hypothetical protein
VPIHFLCRKWPRMPNGTKATLRWGLVFCGGVVERFQIQGNDEDIVLRTIKDRKTNAY